MTNSSSSSSSSSSSNARKNVSSSSAAKPSDDAPAPTLEVDEPTNDYDFSEELDCECGHGHWFYLQWYHPSYICDYGCILFTFLIIQFGVGEIEPNQQFIPDPSNNVNFAYPNNDDIVPTWALVFYCFLFPAAIVLLIQIWKRSLHDVHNMGLGPLSAAVTTFIFVESVKIAAGRPRPHFLAAPDGFDSRKSFPSGHSAVSFATLGFLSTYLAGKLHIFSNWSQDELFLYLKPPSQKKLPAHHRKATSSNPFYYLILKLMLITGSWFSSILVLLPIGLATWIAVSRVVDYHHNYDDILAGALIGGVFAFYYYNMHFHPLFSPKSHLPKKRWELSDGYQ